MNAPCDIGDAVARRVELPVRRPNQLAVRIDFELQPPARFFFDLLGPAHHPFMKCVLRRDEVRELERNGFGGASVAHSECDGGGKRASCDEFLQRHRFLPLLLRLLMSRLALFCNGKWPDCHLKA